MLLAEIATNLGGIIVTYCYIYAFCPLRDWHETC